MSINFDKNEISAIQRRKNILEFVEIRLSWSKRRNFGKEFDLDLSCFLLNEFGKLIMEKDLIFYNNYISSCESVIYDGDNRIGGDIDSNGESITIDFPKIRQDISQVMVAVSIHDASSSGQKFGMVNDAFLEIINRRNGNRLARYELSEELALESAAVICGFYLEKNIWHFMEVDERCKDGLTGLARHYGIKI